MMLFITFILHFNHNCNIILSKYFYITHLHFEINKLYLTRDRASKARVRAIILNLRKVTRL